MQLGSAAGMGGAQSATTAAARCCSIIRKNVCWHSGRRALPSRRKAPVIITSEGIERLTERMLKCDKGHRISEPSVSLGGTNPASAGFIPGRLGEEMRHEHEPPIAGNFPPASFLPALAKPGFGENLLPDRRAASSRLTLQLLEARSSLIPEMVRVQSSSFAHAEEFFG